MRLSSHVLRLCCRQEHETCGSHIGSVDLNGDGTDEILLGEGTELGQPHLVRIYSLDGDLLN